MFVANLCMGNKLQDFFHPNHVVIAVELAATFGEDYHFCDAHMGMEIFSVVVRYSPRGIWGN